MLNLFLSMCEWGAPAPKGITKATDQGLTHWGGWGYLGLVLELGDLNPHYPGILKWI